MDYNKLVSVTGLSGLYELISSKADGGIVRSLEDKTTKFVSTRIHNFSHLESIEVYTTKDNVNLIEIFNAMKASTEAMPDGKADNKDIKAYFEKVYPDMDFERVYGSDMKKMVKWYHILVANNVELKLSEATEEAAPAPEAAAPAKVKPSASPKAATAKAAPPKKINTPRKMA